MNKWLIATKCNDRFKFRAWHKKGKFMDDICKLCLDNDPSYFCIKLKDPISQKIMKRKTNTQNPTDYVIMQSTGLTDKNGKLIFEKDLLWNGRYYPDTGERIVHTVEWKDGAYFAFTQMGKSKADDCIFTGKSVHEWNQCEVIGNLYTTPELLPKQS